MDGDRGAAILTEFRTPLGSLRMPGFAGPGGIPLMAEFPAPADPAIGVPTKPWADAEADIPTITVSARASLLEALNMKNSFFFGVHEMCKLDLERVAPGTTKLHFIGGIIRWRSARTRAAKLETAVWTAVRSHEGRGVLAVAKMVTSQSCLRTR